MPLLKRPLTAACVAVVLLLLASSHLSVYRLTPALPPLTTTAGGPDGDHSAGEDAEEEEGWCSNVAGRRYLDSFASTWTVSCPPVAGQASMVCFQTDLEEKADNFCVLANAVYNPRDHGATPPISMRHRLPIDAVDAPQRFRSYFNHTGVGEQLQTIHLNAASSSPEAGECHPPIMVVKLEGTGDIWHSMLEIWSARLTIDILRRAKPARDVIGLTTLPGGDSWDGTDVQIYMENMSSELHASPIFDLWRLVTGRPPANTTSLARGCYKSVILPLAGGGHPFWKDHWRSQTCDRSSLLNSFVDRAVAFYGVQGPPEPSWKKIIRVSIFIRPRYRMILHQRKIIKRLHQAFPTADVYAHNVDAMNVTQQIQLVQATDVLVGLTGAELTHAMFLKPGGALVEMLRPEPGRPVSFESLARMRGVEYSSMPATEKPNEKKNGLADIVEIDEEVFLHTVGDAVAAVQERIMRANGAVLD
ncbi:EGF domain-specific O-linked N-acetylglucosamine transferase [Drechslerella dactyloides]|uniref:EGF domain-specific O-linked N-acetylglucosamine transferase n=1 Tax=Drechslerella dactyloides TaxID=74499 RepID=A0AAD6NMC3_DREDA|nr:EGF domain-specific O-linked N-acetylglucosamine transferase [Drechslerella dactyloides]